MLNTLDFLLHKRAKWMKMKTELGVGFDKQGNKQKIQHKK